jgi:ketosteroid isomerase-like protein
MRYLIFFLIAALCVSAGTLSAAEKPELSPEQQAVIHISKLLADAAYKRDFAAWSQHVAEDCLFSDDDGALQTKSQLMEHLKKLPTSYDRGEDQRDFVVHVYGNTAVVTSRVTDHEQFNESDIISEMRRTETYIKQDGSWLLIAKQWGMLPVNFRKPVAVDPATYNDYAGQYEWRQGFVDNVVVRDKKLQSQLGEDADEYLPLGPDTFFIRNDLGAVTFSRNAQGHVTGYTYHRADGQEIHARKIK